MSMDDEAVKQEIAKYWQDNGNFQADLGTNMHRTIELFLNDAKRDVSCDSTAEMQQFFIFFKSETYLHAIADTFPNGMVYF